MLLDPADRLKFVAYCEEEANDYEKLATEAARLPGVDHMVKHMRMKAAAFAFVARELKAIEPG